VSKRRAVRLILVGLVLLAVLAVLRHHVWKASPAVDDVEEVRTALGYGRLNVMGGSYGTRVVLTYCGAIRRACGSGSRCSTPRLYGRWSCA
jgi:pimeloyl-ACP methyl ester carboxylesterase